MVVLLEYARRRVSKERACTFMLEEAVNVHEKQVGLLLFILYYHHGFISSRWRTATKIIL